MRSFNRYWTQVLGLLDAGLLGTEHPLPEARVIYELARRPVCERGELRRHVHAAVSRRLEVDHETTHVTFDP